MIRLKSICPAACTDRLENPGRGFYSIYRFELRDASCDIEKDVDWIYVPEKDDLLLAEINLREYAGGEISDSGMAHLKELFSSFKKRGGSYILRFLYDWDGRNMESEPHSLSVILRHMQQIGQVIRAYQDIIYLLQGLFIGNWGEMHSSRFMARVDQMKLYDTLRMVSGPDLLLSVRTPVQWRLLTGIPEGTEASDAHALAAAGGKRGAQLLGLYNDGIMGSDTDLGSYAAGSREKELDFQELVCRVVPNGGEIVSGGEELDFGETVETLERMHVSYLNRHHDQQVMDHFRNSTVPIPGIWKGIDGMTYVERHLGYRFFISDASLHYHRFRGQIQIRVTLKNEGFAPVYEKPEAQLILVSGMQRKTFIMDCDLSSLSGGSHRGGKAAAELLLPAETLEKGTYELYFILFSRKYGREIFLGNERVAECGYLIGRMERK